MTRITPSRFVLLIVGVLVFSLQSAGPAYGASQQDPNAVSLIQRVLAANGFANIPAFQSLQASGEIHHFWAGTDVSETAQIYAVGADKFRLDSDGTLHQQIQTDGQRGRVITGATEQRVDAASFVITKNPLLPVLELATALTYGNSTIRWLGATTQPNTVAVAVQKSDPDFSDFGVFNKVYIIDEQSLTIVQTVETAAFSFQDKLNRTYTYGGFTTVQGVTLPTTISESIGEQNTWTLRLTNVALNVSLSNDLFKF